MEKTLKKSVATLQRLNNYVDKKIVNDEIIKEEFENIEDFKKLQKNMAQRIETIEALDPYNIEKVKESLFDMHLLVMDYYWHLDQPKVVIEKFIGRYRELIDLKDTGK